MQRKLGNTYALPGLVGMSEKRGVGDRKDHDPPQSEFKYITLSCGELPRLLRACGSIGGSRMTRAIKESGRAIDLCHAYEGRGKGIFDGCLIMQALYSYQ